MSDKIKKLIEKVPENKKSKIKENEKIINIVENILYFNQSGQGLKTFTPNQMLSRLPISLAQLKARNNSLYRSKNLTKKICKHLINTI